MKQYILYNPLSGNGSTRTEAEIVSLLSGDAYEENILIDVTKISSLSEAGYVVAPDDRLVICGGDGTLNHFVNSADADTLPCDIYYLANGTGNDFLHDIPGGTAESPINVSRYLKHLPEVTVNGKTYRFLNNIGFGIDGYCTEVGDEMRAAHKEKINYTAIAIKGLLGKFRPVNATISVDGITKEYRNVWLVPTMNGRFYGGGMMPTPGQDRLNAAHTVSVMVFRGKSRLKTLCVFPSIFEGEHLKHKEMVEILTGKHITVEFDRETPLQIDGETLKNITKYEVFANTDAPDPA